MAITNARNGYINGTTSGWVARSLFSVGSDLYAVVLNTSAVLIEVHKSTDYGATWTEQDSSNSLSHAGATYSYDANMPLSGTETEFIYVAYRTATNTVRVRRFDTSADTWESTDIDAADATTAAHSDFGLGIAIRSDNDVILGYRNSSTNDTAYTVYEGTNWAAGVNVHTTNTSILMSVTMTGNSDMCHFLFFESTANDLTQRSLDNTNALGTVGDLDASAMTGPLYSGFMSYVNDGGTHRIAAAKQDSTGEFDFNHSTSSSAPTWSAISDLSPTTTTDPGMMGGTVVPMNGKYWTVWSGDGRGSIHGDVSDDYATPAFGTDVDIVTGLANDPAVYAVATPTGVGVLYTNHTTPSVDFKWAWGSPAPAIIEIVETIKDGVGAIASTGLTITKSASLADGDVVYIFLAMNGGTMTSGPTGFTQIALETTQANPKCYVYRKVITSASGEGSWDFTTSSVTKTAISITLRNVDNTTPEDATITQATNSTSSNAMTVAEVTTVTDDALLLYSAMMNSSTNAQAPPVGMYQVSETTDTKRQSLAWEARPSLGATGSRTGVAQSTSLAWGAFLIAVRPESTGGGNYSTPSNNIALGTTAPTYSSAFNYSTGSNNISLGTPAPTYSFAANYTTAANNIALGTPAPEWSRNSEAFVTPANNIALGTTAPTYTRASDYSTPANNIALGTPAPTWSATYNFATPSNNIVLGSPAPTYSFAADYATPANGITFGAPAPTYDTAAAGVSYETPANNIALGAPAPTYSFAADYATAANNIALGTPAPTYAFAANYATPSNNIAFGTTAPTWSAAYSYTTGSNNISFGAPAPTYTAVASVIGGILTGTEGYTPSRIMGTIGFGDRVAGTTGNVPSRIIGAYGHADRMTGTEGQIDRITGTVGRV